MEDATLRQAIHRLIERHGPAAVALELTAYVGWQARYYPLGKAERIATATKNLTEASYILEELEQEDAREVQ